MRTAKAARRPHKSATELQQIGRTAMRRRTAALNRLRPALLMDGGDLAWHGPASLEDGPPSTRKRAGPAGGTLQQQKPTPNPPPGNPTPKPSELHPLTRAHKGTR